MNTLVARGPCATAVSILVLASSALAQSTWYVDDSAPGPGTGLRTDPYNRIQLALDAPATQPGDLILVAPGVYPENVRIDRFGITLRSVEGAESTIVQASSAGSALVVQHEGLHATLVEGFTFEGGNGSPLPVGSVGGGVLLQTTDATFVDCIVTANRALRGGGMAVLGARLVARGLVLEANVAELGPRTQDGHGGGLYLERSPGTVLQGGRIAANKAGRGGGLYAESSVLTLEGVSIEGNFIGPGDYLDQCSEGGGLYVYRGEVRLHESDVVANLARGSGTRGGGARLILSQATIQGGSFQGNAAGAFWPDTWHFESAGGGLSSECSPLVEGTRFESNRAGAQGGAIEGHGRFLRCTLRDNFARLGGAAWVGYASDPPPPDGCYWGALCFERCEFVDNLAEGPCAAEGGAVWGPALLEHCRLADNGARGCGGAAAHATLIDCVVEDNIVTSANLCAPSMGGGAYECRVERSVLRNNVALGVGKAFSFGGGLYGGSALRTIFHGNKADYGGGVAQGTLQPLENLTLWGNQASYAGGGIYFLRPGFVRNSILWQNVPDCIGGVAPESIVTWSDVQGGCPGLGNEDVPPCFWGPESGDFHLLPGSPCIDSGDPRGPADPDGTRADKGALSFDAAWCGEPQRLCEARTDSAGCRPSIEWSGLPSKSGPDDFAVDAASLRGGRPGALLLSRRGIELPLSGGGVLCIARPMEVLAAASSGGDPAGLDCSGSFSFALPQALLAEHGLDAGSTVFVQILYRDSGVGPYDIGLTDALRFTVCQ